MGRNIKTDSTLQYSRPYLHVSPWRWQRSSHNAYMLLKSRLHYDNDCVTVLSREWLFTMGYITSVQAPLILIIFTVDAAINKYLKIHLKMPSKHILWQTDSRTDKTMW